MENSRYMRSIWTIIAVALCVIAVKDLPIIGSADAEGPQVMFMALCNWEGTACADIISKKLNPNMSGFAGNSYNAIGISGN